MPFSNSDAARVGAHDFQVVKLPLLLACVNGIANPDGLCDQDPLHEVRVCGQVGSAYQFGSFQLIEELRGQIVQVHAFRRKSAAE